MADDSAAVWSDPRWCRAAVAFNLAPVVGIDPTWLAPEGEEGPMAALAGHPRGAAHVSRHLLDEQGLDGQWAVDFSSRRARLGLLPREALQALFLYVGLALRSGEIRMELTGKRIKWLRTRLGDQAVNFAIRSAPLLGPVPQFELEARQPDPRLQFVLLGAAFSLEGPELAQSAFARRVALKLPRPIAEELVAFGRSRAGAGPAPDLPPITAKLVRQMLARWSPLFA